MISLPPVLALLGLQASDFFLIMILVFLLFGAHKIPELARSLGKAQREFQRARDELETRTDPSPVNEEERVRRAARDLGIATEGKSLDDVRQAIAQKVQAGPSGSSHRPPAA